MQDKFLEKRMKLCEAMARIQVGNASEADRQYVEEWKRESPKNAEKLKRILQLAEKEKLPELPMDKMWKEFEKRIREHKIRKKRLYACAAVLLLPLALSWFLYSGTKTPEAKYPLMQQTDSKNNKACLILGNGRIVALSEYPENGLQEKNGVKIILQGDELHYDADSISPDSFTYNTLIVPAGKIYSLTLADGTTICLNADSRLKYPVIFSDTIRQVELSGEGYFKVSKRNEQPFIVKVDEAEVRVLGTTFNVSAYPKEKLTATLVKGTIEVSKNNHKVTLHPDEQASWLDKQNCFGIEKVDARKFTLWKEGVFWFEDRELETILDQLTHWYGLNVTYLSTKLQKMRFSLEMKRYEKVEEVLRKIELTKKVKFRINGRQVAVYE